MAEEGEGAEVEVPPPPPPQPFEGNEEEQAAAVKLQAMQRGRIARAEVEKLKAEGAAAEVIVEKEAEAALFEGSEEEQAAAVRLQAMQRGRMARAEVARLKDTGATEEEVAAAVAEVEEAAAFEGTEEEQAAATKLQAVQRGRMARSEVSKMKDVALVPEETAPAEAGAEAATSEPPASDPPAEAAPAAEEAPAPPPAEKEAPAPEAEAEAEVATPAAEAKAAPAEEAEAEAPDAEAEAVAEAPPPPPPAEEAAAAATPAPAAAEAEAEVVSIEGNAEEQAAAVKLQAMQRGRIARAEVEKLKAEGAAAEVIVEKEAEAALFEGSEEEQAAAVRLQAMQRGRMARAEVARLKDTGATEEEVAAAVAEVEEAAAFEGTEEEQAAATKLQAVQRGRMARSEVSKMKDGGTAEAEAAPASAAVPPPAPAPPAPEPKPELEEEEEDPDVIVEEPTPVPQRSAGPVSYAAAGYTTVPNFPLGEVKRSFQEAALQGDGIRATRLELATAVLNNAVLAPMMDQPARTPIFDGSDQSEEAPAAETLQAIVAELRSVEGTSDEDVAIGIEAFFSFFGAGSDEVEALSTAVFDLQGDELAERGEDELIQQLNRELGRDHDGDAKVVLLGGAGAQEGKRSVYRFWPDIVKRSESDETGATERDIFEDDVGAQYALSDMSVLDVASLHWSKPRTVGNPPPERVGHATAIVPMRIHATPSTQMTTPEPGESASEPEAGSDGRYGYDGSIQLSSLVAHCADIARQGKHDGNDIFAQHALGKVLANTLMHCWASSLRRRGRGGDTSIPASHVSELIRLLDGGRADPPESGAGEEGTETEGEGETARMFRQMLEAMDSKNPPREKDGARDPLAMRKAFLASSALLSALPRIMRDAEKRTTGTPEHLVFAADSLVLTGGAPPNARCVWVNVECATPVDADEAAAKAANDGEEAEAAEKLQTEVPEELSFRTPYFFPGHNGGWAPEGEDPKPPEKPGQTRCDFGWETAINVGYAGRNASTMRASLVRMVEQKLRHSLSFTVYAATDAGGGGDVPELEEVKIGEVKVDLVNIVESGRDVSHEWLPVLSVESGAQIGWIKVTIYAQRALRTMLFAMRRAYLDAFQVVVFGGRSPSLTAKEDAGLGLRKLSPVADLAVYSAATNAWTSPQGSKLSPEPRWGHTLVSSRSSVIMFGGTNGTIVFDDVYVLDTGSMTWRQPKSAAAMLEDAKEHGMGMGDLASVVEREKLLEAAGKEATAEPRQGHTMDVVENLGGDQQGSLAVVIGGESNGGKIVGTVQLMDMSPVTRLGGNGEPVWLPPVAVGKADGTSESSSPALLGHATAAVREGPGTFSVYLFGGRQRLAGGKTAISGDLWQLRVTVSAEDGAAWEPEKATAEWSQPTLVAGGKTPPAREGARLVAVGRMLVLMHGWAGTAQTPWLRDCWIFDTRKNMWISVAFADHYPSARYGHTATLIDFRQAIPSLATLTMPKGEALPTTDGAPKLMLKVGAPCDLQLTARDSRGCVAIRAGDNYHCVLRPRRRRVGPDGSDRPLGLVAHPSVTDTGDGSYDISFTPLVVGPHELWVLTEKGEHVVGSPIHVQVDAGRAAVDRTVASGPGIHEGKSEKVCEFFIKARDLCGNLSAAGIENFSVSMEGPPVMALGGMNANCDVTIDAVPGSKGTFRCTYKPQFAGLYRLSVRQGKAHVTGSPFTVRVLAGAPVPSYSTAYGRGLRKQWYTGREARFVVTARDKFANKLTVGGEQIVFKYATLLGSPAERSFEGEVTDNGNGTYSCTYTPQEVGPARIDVGMVRFDAATGEKKVVPISESPFTLNLTSNLMSPAHCTASGPGTGEGEVQAATMTRFIIEARDKLGNPLGGGGDEFQVYINGPRGTVEEYNLTDMDDGSYLVSYTPRRSGEYTIEVRGRPNPEWTKGKEQAFERVGAPGQAGIFNLFVLAGPTAAAWSTVAGDAMFGDSVSREPTTFSITASDAFGNRRHKGGDDFEVKVRAAWDVPVDVDDHDDGTYTCTFVCGEEPEYQGCTVYMISVMLNGEHVVGSPFAHKVKPLPTDARKTSVVGFTPLVTAMEPCEFLVQARDEAGRDCLQGMDDMAVAFEGTQGTRDDFSSVLMDIKDLKNGTYLVRMVSERKSFFRIRVSITMNDVDIKDSPLDVTIVPSGLFNVGFWGQSETRLMDERTATEEFVLHGLGLEHAVAGEHTEFDILSKRMGEDTPGDAFRVELRGPEFVEGVIGPAEGPLEGGLYTAQYCCTLAGSYVGTVKLGRWVISGQPFQLEVKPDRTSAEHCKVEGAGLVGGQAGVESTFNIVSYDMHGNLAYNPEDVFQVVMKGGGRMGKSKKFRAVEVTANVFDQQNGTYSVTFVPPLEGNFLVSVSHTTGSNVDAFVSIKDSPFACVVKPGEKKKRSAAPALSGEDRNAMKKNDGALAAELLAQEAAQKAGMPVGGKLPPLAEEGQAAPAKPLFGLRKMLAAKAGGNPFSAPSGGGATPKPAVPSIITKAQKEASALNLMARFAGPQKAESKKGGLLAALGGMMDQDKKGPMGKLFTMGFWTGAEAILGKEDDAISVASDATSYAD